MDAARPLFEKNEKKKANQGSIPVPKGETKTRKSKNKKEYARDTFIAAGQVNFLDSDKVKEFERKYKRRLGDRRPDRPLNEVLLIVAKGGDWPTEANWSDEKTKHFLDLVLEKYCTLFEAKDDLDKMSPLHLALKHSHSTFVDAVLSHDGSKVISKIISETRSDGTVLHIAVERCRSSIDLLITKCAQHSTLFKTKRLEDGNTPLHICMSLDSIDGHTNYDEDSDSSESDEDYEGTEENRSVDQSTESDGDLQSTARSEPPEEGSQLGMSSKSETTPGVSPDPYEISEIVQKLIKSDPSVLEIKNKEGRTPYQERIYHLRKMKGIDSLPVDIGDREATENLLRKAIADDKIASEIRSYCLSNLPRDTIMKCLYQTGHEKSIEFDLGGLQDKNISKEYLKQLSKHLRFESILKYVALPKLTIEEPIEITTSRNRLRRHPLKSTKLGRSDLVALFGWLRENHVQKILKVIVLDDRDPCHADSSIEEALKGFNVEIWDWKRVDLSSEVICNSTKVVKEVSLYCSGNNAVLMGWASQEGLSNQDKFPKLKRVNLFIRKGLEEQQRLDGYVETFKERIKSLSEERIEVQHFIDDDNISDASGFRKSPRYFQPENKWIESVAKLARFLHSADPSMRRVKLAIIDDGVDTSMASLDGMITTGESFSPYTNSSELMNPYFVSSNNHGTCMATLICKLCPMVQLYVARLHQLQVRGSSQSHITAKSAAEAVSWATKCKVDIISMSWTIETPVEGNEDMKKLETAIEQAAKSNILMFCSTSDQGSMTKEWCYPAKFPNCIKIGSATNTGDPMTWVNTEMVDFILPGSDVPFLNNEGKVFSYESGSSVATAAASGLAGMLIFASWLLKTDDTYFKNFKSMFGAFEYLSGRGSKYPRVADHFEKRFKEKLAKLQGNIPGKQVSSKVGDLSKLSWDDKCEKALDHVMNLIRDQARH